MTRRGWLLSIVLVGFATDGSSGSVECRPNASAVRDIRAVATGLVAADNRRDIERVVGYYSVDAVLMPPGEAPVLGRDRIRPRYEALFATFTPAIEPRIDEACAGPGLGLVRGRNGGRLIPRASGEARVLDDAFIMLLRPEPDGVWRISHLIWHRQSEAGVAQSQPQRQHRVERELGSQGQVVGDTSRWQDEGPAAFLERLKATEGVYAVDGTHVGWIRDEDLAGLVALLESRQQCSFVVSSAAWWKERGQR